MKKVFQLTSFILACMMLFALAMPVFAEENIINEPTRPLPPVEGETSPFGVYVNGIPVTETNKDDILGDLTDAEQAKTTFARAVWSEEDKELVLSGNLVLTGATVMNDVKYGILSTSDEEEITVRIKEGSFITFCYGVRVECGDFISKEATITFDGTTNTGGDSFVRVGSGSITMESSRVECKGTALISSVSEDIPEPREIPAGVGFAADYVTLTRGTRVILTSAARMNPLYAVIWARKHADITSKTTLISSCENDGYYADTLVYAGDRCRVVDSHLNVSGLGCVFELPTADLYIREESEILSTSVFGLLLGGESIIEGDSYLEITSRDGGIAVVGEDASIHIEEGTGLYFRQNDRVISSALARHYTWSAYRDAAFYSENAPVTMSKVKFTATGYTFGILCLSTGEKLSFSGRFDINSDVAFLALTEDKTDLRFGTEVKGDVALFTIPATGLETYGSYVSALVPMNDTLGLNGNAIDSLFYIKDVLWGYANECHIDVEVFPVIAVVVPGLLFIVITLIIILLYKTGHIFTKHRKKKGETETAEVGEESADAEKQVQVTEENTDE